MTPTDPMTTAEAAELLETTERTLIRWRASRLGPPFYRPPFGRKGIVYSRAEVVEWDRLNRTPVRSTA